MRTQIFISYRRDGGLEAAKYIYDLLHERHEVFFDMESLRNGRFDINIEDSIKNCTDFILILSKNVFARFNDDGDWISREVELALKHSKNIIPIFLDGFVVPSTNNAAINTVMNYNGIQLTENAEFFEKLITFLRSNRNCVLKIGCEEGGYFLEPSAIDMLKEIYRNIVASRENEVQVHLEFPSAEEACEKLVPIGLSEEERRSRIAFKKQTLLGKQQNHREGVEKAIELMIGDRCNTEYPSIAFYLQNDPLAREHYFDEDGRLHDYGMVCVWKNVIEELLKEFTIDDANRLTHYRNMRDIYTCVDCVIDRISKTSKRDWYFISCVKNEEAAKDVAYYQFMKHSPLELSAETILKNILPDFYHKMALELMYSREEELKAELMDPESRTKFLLNYWFGLR